MHRLLGEKSQKMLWAAVLASALSATACRTGFQQIANPTSGSQQSTQTRADPEIFTLLPSAVTLIVGTSKSFVASNGTPPYVFSMVTGPGGITTAGLYSAPNSAGSAIIKATDVLGRVAVSTLTINPPLSLSAATQYVQRGSSFQLPIVGGVPPYGFSLLSGSVGEVGLDGSYISSTAGTATVRVADATGASAQMSLSIYNPLQIVTDKTITVVSSLVQLSAVGGVMPYAYNIGSGLGTINSSHQFLSQETGPFPLQEQVCVRDVQGNRSCQSIQVVSTISINTPATTIAVGNSVDLSIAGGVPPFSVQETTVGGAHGSLSASACAVPSARCMSFRGVSVGTSTVVVTDSDHTTNQILITINPPLTLSPATAALPVNFPFTFVPVGGVSPFVFNAIGGSMVGATLTTPATLGPVTVTATDARGNTSSSAVNVTNMPIWPGIATVTSVSPSSMRVTWMPYNSPGGFSISWTAINCTPSVFNTCATQTVVDSNSTHTSYVVTGLSPNTKYQFGVEVSCPGGCVGVGAGVPRTLTETTGNIDVYHRGWSDLRATGAVTPTSGSGLSAPAAQVRLAWNPMVPSDTGATINGYNIYRGVAPGAESVFPLNSSPIIPGSPTASGTFTDNSSLLYASHAYYYLVKPIVDGLEVSALGTQHPTEIKVVVPPDNMAMVHRWIANQQGCAMLGQASDPQQNYRCNYNWPNGLTTYDVASGSQIGFFVDAFESGCNYSRAACDGTGSSSRDCIGRGAPTVLGVTTAATNAIYYDRLSGTCFIRTPSTWVESAGASAENFRYLASNSPGLPPLSMIPQSQASNACQAQQKLLPTRMQQLAASEWSATLGTAIASLETGGGTNCNTDRGHAVAFESAVIPNNLETLPFANGAGGVPAAYTLRTGSSSTSACVSRYGVQDLVGNVSEWAADQVFCSSYVSNTLNGAGYRCYGMSNTLNGVASNFQSVYLANDNGSGSSDGWNLSTSQAILSPLMLPVLSSAGYATRSPSSFALGSNQFRLYGNVNPGTRGVLSGGAWYGADPVNGTQGGGRFSLDISKFSNIPDASVGFRCVVPVQ